MFGHQSNNDHANSGHQDQPADAVLNGLEPQTVSPSPSADTTTTPPSDQPGSQPTEQPNLDPTSVDAAFNQADDQYSGSDYVMTDLPSVPANDQPAQKPVSAGDPLNDLATSNDDAGSVPVVNNPPAPADDVTLDTPSDVVTTVPEPTAATAVPAPVVDTPTAPMAAPAAAPPLDAATLLNLKQSALHELSPLLGHLEQSPEEKFRTTMMMIQASDDQSLLQSAYDTAKSIEDEKARAQALLDVVNEINYFSQQTQADNVNVNA